MPRAVVATAYGGPEVVDVIDVPGREPGPGEVAIAVRAAALNPVDAKNAAGLRDRDPSLLPLRLGYEAAGVVAAVGADPVSIDGTALAVGNEVLGFRLAGALSSELTVPAKDVIHKPASIGFGEASGLLLVAATAADALVTIELRADETVLVHGAAGSVGLATVQLARRRGARVIGTAAEHRHDALRALGAEPIAYGPGLLDRVRALGPVDAAIDTVGTDEALEVSLALLADPARLVTIANAEAVVAAGGKAVGGVARAAFRDSVRAELVGLAAAGELHVPVVAEYPLEQARAAFEHLAEGHAGGKIVLVP